LSGEPEGRSKNSGDNYLEHSGGFRGHCEELGTPVSKENSPDFPPRNYKLNPQSKASQIQPQIGANSHSKSRSKNPKHISDQTSLSEIAPDRDYVILGRSSVSLTEFSGQRNTTPKRIADYTLSKKQTKPRNPSEKVEPSPENPEKKARFKRQETKAPKKVISIKGDDFLDSESDLENLDEAALQLQEEEKVKFQRQQTGRTFGGKILRTGDPENPPKTHKNAVQKRFTGHPKETMKKVRVRGELDASDPEDEEWMQVEAEQQKQVRTKRQQTGMPAKNDVSKTLEEKCSEEDDQDSDSGGKGVLGRIKRKPTGHPAKSQAKGKQVAVDRGNKFSRQITAHLGLKKRITEDFDENESDEDDPKENLAN
jgi:hypothetical protein